MLFINKALFAHEKKMLFNRSRLALIVTTTIIFLATLTHLIVGQFPASLYATPYRYVQLTSLMVWLIFPYLAVALFNLDRQSGALNRLMSLPFSESELVFNKLYAVLFLIIPLAISALLWYGLSYRWYYLDAGLMMASLIELFLVVLLASSSALYFSVISSKNNLSVVYSALFALFLLMGDFLFNASFLNGLWHFIAFNGRLSLLRQGIFNLADVLFFIALSALFINRSIIFLCRKRGISSKNFTLIIVLLLLAMQKNSYQYDLTASRMHQLSSYSKELLRELNAPLYLTYYISPNLEKDVTINQNYRTMLQYQSSKNRAYVNKVVLPSANSAAALGISLQNSNSEQNQYAGVFIEYKEKAIVIPFLVDNDEIEYRISGKIDQLLHGKRKVALITDDNRTEDDLSFLRLALNNQFELTTQFKEADAFVIMGSAHLSRANARQLFTLAEQGRGVLIGLSPKKIPILTDEPPSSIEMSNLQKELYTRGLSVGQDLVFQADSLSLLSKQAGELALNRPYPAWPHGYKADNSQLSSLVSAIKPMYSSYLDINTQWHPLIKSSRHAYLQLGPLDLRPETVLNSRPTSTEQSMAPFVFMAQYREKPFIVMASDTFLSDIIETVAPSNLAYGELLIQQLAGRKGLTDIKMRYWPIASLKQLFNPQSDALALKIVLLLFIALVPALYAIFFKRSR